MEWIRENSKVVLGHASMQQTWWAALYACLTLYICLAVARCLQFHSQTDSQAFMDLKVFLFKVTVTKMKFQTEDARSKQTCTERSL